MSNNRTLVIKGKIFHCIRNAPCCRLLYKPALHASTAPKFTGQKQWYVVINAISTRWYLLNILSVNTCCYCMSSVLKQESLVTNLWNGETKPATYFLMLMDQAAIFQLHKNPPPALQKPTLLSNLNTEKQHHSARIVKNY